MAEVGFKFNLTIRQGDTRPLRWIFDDGATPPVQLDISANDYFYTAKDADDLLTDTADAAAVVQLDPADFTKSESGLEPGTTDQIDASLTIPADLAPGTYEHDLQEKDASGNIVTIGYGQLVVTKQVTQRTS